MKEFVDRGFNAHLTTEGYLEGGMTMMNTMLQYLHRRSWAVLISDRRGEQFVTSDHPVSLTWSDGRKHGFHPPGHAHIGTDVTFPLSSSVALLGRFEPFIPVSEASTENVAAINAKTINFAERFVASCSDDFVVMQGAQFISTAADLIAHIKADNLARRR